MTDKPELQTHPDMFPLLRHFLALLPAAALLGLVSCQPIGPGSEKPGEGGLSSRPRTIITTDGEIDDVDSFIRMLLYANEFRIQGLVYSSSQWHYKGDGAGTPFVSEMAMTRNIYGERTELRWPGTEWMQELIAAYAEVYPNLRQHAMGYPEPDSLLSMVKVGNIDFEGEMDRDTEGSDHIRDALLDDDPSPLYLQVWGGTNTIARALKSIEDTYADSDQWEAVYRRVCGKAVIYAILDQDATYRRYIAPRWPDLKTYYNSNQFWCFAYPWKRAVPQTWHAYLQGAFMRGEILEDHGPLLEKYYAYGDGRKQEGDPEHLHGIALDSFNQSRQGQAWGPFDPYDFISEGDSPAYLHLIDVGLGNLEHPEYGGWGGRLVRSDSTPNRWEDGPRASDYNPFRDSLDTTFPQTRWIPAIQEDFAGRADWCVLGYEQANHPPRVWVEGEAVRKVEPGQVVTLRGHAEDPDGDVVEYKWWVYREAGTYPVSPALSGADSQEVALTIPLNLESGQSIHLILEINDRAEHPMARYQRVILKRD